MQSLATRHFARRLQLVRVVEPLLHFCGIVGLVLLIAVNQDHVTHGLSVGIRPRFIRGNTIPSNGGPANRHRAVPSPELRRNAPFYIGPPKRWLRASSAASKKQ